MPLSERAVLGLAAATGELQLYTLSDGQVMGDSEYLEEVLTDSNIENSFNLCCLIQMNSCFFSAKM